jgi:hypothetical protein
LVGFVYGQGYKTVGIGAFESAPIDAGGATIWEALKWTTDGIYGRRIEGDEIDIAALWHFDDLHGNVALDAGPNGNDGAMSLSGLGETGQFDSAFYFNGSDTAVSVPDSPSLEPAAFTIEAWIKPETIRNRGIVSKAAGGAGYDLYTDASGLLTFELAGNECKDGLPLRVGSWAHLADTYDWTTMRL